jgi:FlaA1/EpsC-like NDP-sugar epimerase
MSIFRKVFSGYFQKRMLPYWAILLTDFFITFCSGLVVCFLSFKTKGFYDNRFAIFYLSITYALLSLIGIRIFKTYSGMLRYSGFVDLKRLASANLVTLVIALGVSILAKRLNISVLSLLTPAKAVTIFLFSTLAMWILRIGVKLLFESVNTEENLTRVLIYGALTGGVGLAKNLRAQNPVKFELAGFISHSQKIKGMKLLGMPVYTLEDDIPAIIEKRKIQGVVVSPHRLEDFRRNQKLQDLLIAAGCKIYMVHGEMEANVKDGVVQDNVDSSVQIREVNVEDLLPREVIEVDLNSVSEQLVGRKVLITGSAGSIGMEIVRQVAAFKPAEMMLIDQAETPQHDVRLMMARDFPDVPCRTVVTSISRRSRMEHIFSCFKPDYVFHAAAYKHVPMMEDNPSEAVINNVAGTKILADLSVKYGVKKFVMISTDKAVNPTNVMGCSKRICEIYVQSLDRKLRLEGLNKEHTQFVTTRFGNVLGSNGSVIPIFREQIKKGGPVLVTDERIVRFFMLIPEACKLVLEAGTKGNGGEIFVFDMGQPVKIVDLARRMIALSGAQGVEIKFTGLRDGEKLYEEVLSEMEGTMPTFHNKIRIAKVREYDYDEVNRNIDELIEIAAHFDNMETVRKMKEIVPEYKSSNSVYESLDK